MLGVETGQPVAGGSTTTAPGSPRHGRLGLPSVPTATQKHNKQSRSQRPANPSRGQLGPRTQSSCIVEAGMCLSPPWLSRGPWAELRGPLPPRFPSEHLHRDTTKKHTNTAAGPRVRGGPGVWRGPRVRGCPGSQGAQGARAHRAQTAPLLPCSVAQPKGTGQSSGTGWATVRHASLRAKTRREGREDSGTGGGDVGGERS